MFGVRPVRAEMEDKMKENVLKVVKVSPMKAPVTCFIENTLEAKQKLVGGNITELYPFEEGVAFIGNEDVANNGGVANRVLFCEEEDSTILLGDFFICGVDDVYYTSLSDDLAAKYMEMFKYPEHIYRVGEKIYMERIGSRQAPMYIGDM